MAATLNNASPFQHQNFIGLLDRAQTVRNNDGTFTRAVSGTVHFA
jgi:hypothetical protein